MYQESIVRICPDKKLQLSVRVYCKQLVIAAEHGRLRRIRQVAPMCHHATHASFAPPVHNRNGVSIGSTVFAAAPAPIFAG